MRPRAPTSASQTTSRRAVPPLALIVSVLFLPTFRRCNEFGFERPTEILDPAGIALWIAPVFGGAALMAVLTVRALLRREVDLTTRRMALALIAGVALVEVGTTAGAIISASGDWMLTASGVAAVAGAVWMIRRGRGQPPWRIWEHLLCAFALLAAGAPMTAFLVWTAATDGVDDFGIGAYVYLLAIAALLWVTSVRSADACRGARPH